MILPYVGFQVFKAIGKNFTEERFSHQWEGELNDLSGVFLLEIE